MGQLADSPPQLALTAVRRAADSPVDRVDLSDRQRAPRAPAVDVDRLAVRDREHPRAQVGVSAQARVGAQCGDERLLEAVLRLERADGRDEIAPDDLAVLVEERLEGR